VTVVESEVPDDGGVAVGSQSSVGNEALSIRQRASSSSSSSHAPESRDSLRRRPNADDSGAADVSRMVSTWTNQQAQLRVRMHDMGAVLHHRCANKRKHTVVTEDRSCSKQCTCGRL